MLLSHQSGASQGGGSLRRGPQVSPHQPLEKTSVALRKVPGALALGLLASLIAHAALYGGGHSMGGDYHDVLIQLALAGGVSLVIFFGLMAWNGAKTAVNGSVLASRLGGRLPGFTALVTSATAWYAAAELVERGHRAPIPLLAVPIALAAAAWLLQRLSRIALSVLAGAIVAFARTNFAPRTPPCARFTARTTPVRPVLWVRRRFARPPPIGFDCCA